MKLICSIATIIERDKAREWIVYYHTYLQPLAFFVEQTQKPRYESGCDFPKSLVVCRARGARTDASKVENNKTQQTTIEFYQPSLLIYKMLHPIHRVRIPYSKVSSPKMCRNIDKSSFKVGHPRLTRFFPLSNAPMTLEGH